MTRVGEDFASRWSVCWTTTYTFAPSFFETFLLRRLGEPPLNAVVLADADRLARLWAEIPADEAWRIRGANRAYLVQPVTVAGAFHPKTVLLANDKQGVLLVGSGNLGESGMERGNELYARYASRDPEDLANFGAWRSWMTGIVTHADDPLLRARWADLLGRVPWLPIDSVGATFVTNWQRSLVDALLDDVAVPIDALWVTAPFYDSGLDALRELIRRAQPRQVMVVLGKDTSVDGSLLRDTLAASGVATRLLRYEPFDFVHAKLVTLFSGDRARVLSGSANLSAPALLRTAAVSGHGNSEAGTLVDMPRGRAEALFVPPDHALVEVDEGLLYTLRFVPVAAAPGPPVRLVAAIRGDDGVVAVTATPMSPGLSLSDGVHAFRLAADRTEAPIPDTDHATLVWLTDQAGVAVSNRVPLADRAALGRALDERTGHSDRPPDLDELDLQHPIGRLLAELHQTVLFDFEAAPATRRIAKLAEDSPDVDPAFWERLLREQLAQDPRLARYQEPSGSAEPLLDELAWLLREMLDRTPAPNILRLLSGEVVERTAVEQAGHRWSTDARLAVHAFNVLHRWCLAIADPRIRWFSDVAPIQHFELLLDAIARIWQQREWIAEDRLVRLLETLFGAFIRTDRAPGFLASLQEEERTEALGRVAAGPGPELAAGLAYAALRVAQPARSFGWQPFLIPGLDWGVFGTGPRSVELVPTLCDFHPSETQIEERINQVATYTDDEHWCAAQSLALGFESIRMRRFGNEHYPLEIEVYGAGDTLTDTRLVTLAREAMAYRRVPGLRLRSGGGLVTLSFGTRLYGRVGDVMIESIGTVQPTSLDRLEQAGHGFEGLLDLGDALAS